MSRAVQILCLGTTLSLFGCHKPPIQNTPDPMEKAMASAIAPTQAQLAAFTQQSHIALPGSATYLRYYENRGGMDDAVWIQFRLPAAELQQFITAASIPTAQIRRGTNANSYPFSCFRGWLSKAPKSFEQAEASIAPGRFVQCIFDLDDPQATMVYLMWGET